MDIKKYQLAAMRVYIETSMGEVTSLDKILKPCKVGKSFATAMSNIGVVSKVRVDSGKLLWQWMLKAAPSEADVLRIIEEYKRINREVVEKYGLNKKKESKPVTQEALPLDAPEERTAREIFMAIESRLATIEAMLLDFLSAKEIEVSNDRPDCH